MPIHNKCDRWECRTRIDFRGWCGLIFIRIGYFEDCYLYKPLDIKFDMREIDTVILKHNFIDWKLNFDLKSLGFHAQGPFGITSALG